VSARRPPTGVPRVSPLRRLMVGGTAAAATIGFIVLLLLAWGLWTYHGPGPEAKAGKATIVQLRRGSGVNEIASILETAGAVRSAPVFAAAAQLTGAARSLKAGEYEIPSRTSMAGVLRKLREGAVVRHFVTIPEGVTAEMTVDILMANPILVGGAPVPPEGAILPETYEVTRGEDRASVLARMMDARDKLLVQLWAQRSPGLPYNTPEEAVILASIVEKETAKPEERPMIARVFVNRLQSGMRLQSDPTIIYGISRGKPLGRGIRQSELLGPTPYNTYAVDGLPPTPIANPGRESLAAAVAPPPGDQLYFVADGTGGHAFASTLEEHERNVAKWREIERRRAGEMLPAPKAKAR